MGTSTSVGQPTDDYMIQFTGCRFQLSTDLPTQIYHQPTLARMHVAVLCVPRDPTTTFPPGGGCGAGCVVGRGVSVGLGV